MRIPHTSFFSVASTAEMAVSHPGVSVKTSLLSSRLFWVKVVVCLGMMAGLLLSRSLWLSERFYPLSPIADWLPAIPPPLDRIWYSFLLALLVATLFMPQPRLQLIVFVIAAGLLPLWDQSRLQPWFYQYLFMLAALGAAPWPRREALADDGDRLLNPCRLILVCIYLYSGAQKCNAAFMADSAPWLLKPTLDHLPTWFGDLLLRSRYAIPATEMLIGAGLLIRVLRLPAIILAIGMHAFILWTLGPWGHDWNTVVWPWNVAMMILVPLLFLRTRGVTIPAIAWGPRRAIFPKLVLLLFGIMPLLSFAGWWDLYLSSALYSGNTPIAHIEFDRQVYAQLPPAVQEKCWKYSEDSYELHYTLWTIAELNVPDYPAERVQIHIAETIARRFPNSEIGLTLTGRPKIWTGERARTRRDFNVRE
jgi:hypothetical protein